MPKENYIAFPDAAYDYHHGKHFAESCDECAEQQSDCSPIACRKVVSCNTYRLCCDQNGCCCLYPASCRNKFWPEFSHPRWLCCKDLYSGGGSDCYDCCEEEPKPCHKESEE